MNDVMLNPPRGLSPEALQTLDEIVDRRMKEKGETLYQARDFVAKWLMAVCDDRCD